MKKLFLITASLLLFGAVNAQVTTPVSGMTPAGVLTGNEILPVQPFIGGKYQYRRTTTGDIAAIASNSITIDSSKYATKWWVNNGYVPMPLWSNIQSKPSSFAPSAHTHTLSDLSQSGATTGQVPIWNGSVWAAGTVSSGGGSYTSGTGISINSNVISLADERYTSAEKTKLAAIASGATANSTDAQLRDRSTHTGVQTASTISDFTTAARSAISGGAGISYNSTTGVITATGGGSSDTTGFGLATRKQLNDTAAALRAAIGTGGGGSVFTTPVKTTLSTTTTTAAFASYMPNMAQAEINKVVLGKDSQIYNSGYIGFRHQYNFNPQYNYVMVGVDGSTASARFDGYGNFVLTKQIGGGNERVATWDNDGYLQDSKLKTINGQSLFGTGDIAISGSGSGSTLKAGQGIKIVNDTVSMDWNGKFSDPATLSIANDSAVLTQLYAKSLYVNMQRFLDSCANIRASIGTGGGGGGTPTGTASSAAYFNSSGNLASNPIQFWDGFAGIKNTSLYISDIFINSHYIGSATSSNLSLGGWDNPASNYGSVTIQSNLVLKGRVPGTGNINDMAMPVYANDAAADADSNLPSGAVYMLTGSRVLYRKP